MFAGQVTATVRCYRTVTVFADGVNKFGPENKPLWSGDIADTTSVLAVKCIYSVAVVRRLLVSVPGILISDSTWKCSNTYTIGWANTTFDDNQWSQAHVLGTNWGPVGQLNQDSVLPNYTRWLWTDNQQDGTVYCRGRTGTN